ncbi:glycosyltransferase [Agromyces sp. H66]|uniref:glycosyltransferase n=1 Tax=Agromyces sp. H66 TaxID=2529859 RepID=UPI00145A4B07|nr:glycosyltransferase [Agromyces sp. H66]
MTEIVLAHDYLVQTGGAERVVATWASGFGARSITTLAYRPESTFEVFASLEVKASLPPAFAGHVERLLPALPAIAGRTTVRGGDVALASSSGWAHRFRYEMPHVVYVHTPARWLYAADDYRLRLSRVRRAGLTASTPLLRRGDREAMARASAIVANSAVTQQRIRDAYELDSIVVHPPVEPVAEVAIAPQRALPEEFAVVVARDRGYKNVALAVEAARAAGLSIVVVGAGSEVLTERSSGVYGLGRVTDEELCWVYRTAAVVLGAGREDFGLTVIEAALEGTPAATIAAGGYLETVMPGVNGFYAASDVSNDVEALATAVTRARSLGRAECVRWAEQFSAEAHRGRLLEALGEAGRVG